MNDRLRLLIDDVLTNTPTTPARAVWTPTAVLPGMLLLGGGLILISLRTLYDSSYYGIAFDCLSLLFAFLYGWSFSTRIIYKLAIISQLPEDKLRGVPVYFKKALKKSFYVFFGLYICTLIVSFFFVFHVLLSNIAMFAYLILNVIFIKVIYSVFVLDLQRILLPIAGGLASSFIDKKELP